MVILFNTLHLYTCFFYYEMKFTWHLIEMFSLKTPITILMAIFHVTVVSQLSRSWFFFSISSSDDTFNDAVFYKLDAFPVTQTTMF